MNDQLVGYLAVVVSCLGFGTNFVPAKKVDIRDGQLFNVCLASGVLFVGLCQWAVAGFYRIEPVAMLGGALWATGNLFVPLILANCGLGPGQLTWGLSQILTGWATGRFGLFGKDKDVVANPNLNYAGVGMLMVSLCLFSLMKPPESAREAPGSFSLQRVEDREAAKAEQGSAGMAVPLRDPVDPDGQAGGRLGAQTATQSYGQSSQTSGQCEAPRQAAEGSSANAATPVPGLGFLAAVVAGVLFGSNFDPPTYLKQLGEADQKDGLAPRHSPSDMDYVISHFFGIFATTVVAFAVQKALKPTIYVGKQVVFPGIVAGLMWGIAQVAWFKANGVLSYVVSFPIIVGVPGVIAALWGCWLFGENRGVRNALLLCCVILLQGAAVVLIAISKG